MPYDVSTLKAKFQSLIAPGNDEEFCRLLSEADSRLLESGRWHWGREVISLPVDENGRIQLPSKYSGIGGARIGDVPVGVLWEEAEWMVDGPGTIPIEGGGGSLLVDEGILHYEPEEADPYSARTFRVTGTAPEEVRVIARFAAKDDIESDDHVPLCNSSVALKLMMMSIRYEDSSNAEIAMQYEAMAIKKLKEAEALYRGVAKQVFHPKMAIPLRTRFRQVR